jgi:exosortase C (VPDSG-CTERM-specific)
MAPETGEVAGTQIAGRSESVWPAWQRLPKSLRLRIGACAGCLLLLTLLFVQPLTRLIHHAAGNDLHSHVVLVPFITAYLLYTGRGRTPVVYRTSVWGTIILSGVAAAVLAGAVTWRSSMSVTDELVLLTFAFVAFVAACGFLFLGSEWMSAAAFPVGFLIFMVPLPDAVVHWLEQGSMLASAEAAALYFKLAGVPTLRDGTVFALPGIVLQVAQECSGIRSSWVLFITSLVASHIFLRTRWRRIVLIAFVIPLGILRNGFRILVIGLLCVHIGPQMIDSVIHHRGGPLFFALSLFPLFLLLWWLRRQEQRLKLSD